VAWLTGGHPNRIAAHQRNGSDIRNTLSMYVRNTVGESRRRTMRSIHAHTQQVQHEHVARKHRSDIFDAMRSSRSALTTINSAAASCSR